MKFKVFALLCIASLSFLSCRLVSAQSPENGFNLLKFEKILFKDDIERFHKAVFASDDSSFLVANHYEFINLWHKPFLKPAVAINIEEIRTSGTLTTLFYMGGDQHLFLSIDEVVQIWDSNLKSKEFEFRFPELARKVAISPDGRYIAADGDLYDRQKKALVGRSVAHGSYSDVCFGGGNLVITSGYHDHGVAIRNVHNGLFEYRRSPHPVTGAAISPDETHVVATGNKGRCYLWRLPEFEPTALVTRRDMHSAKFSPDSKWFVVYGEESAHIFQTEPPLEIARLQIEPGLTALQVASANLVAIGDKNGFVQIYDVSARRIIGRHKVCETAAQHLRLIPEKGLLWVGGCCLGEENEEKGEIALYRIQGLAPFIQPQPVAK
jgi:WD40 repeat protein